jgi:hypothetical protein
MKKLSNFKRHFIIASLLALFALAAPIATPSQAMTSGGFLPSVFEALSHDVPSKYFSPTHGEELTNRMAVQLALEAMGWGFEISMYEQLTLVPEWSEKDPLFEIASTMQPPVPGEILADFDRILTDDGAEVLKGWVASCAEKVMWKGYFKAEGTELLLLKEGVGNPKGSANGDLKHGVNEPRYVAMLTVDIAKTKCQIATAVMAGGKKLPLARIAEENYGVIGGINGGYFAGAKPIGTLRRQGYTDNARFHPGRSAFGWNEAGEFVFIDGREVASIEKDKRFDKYTEVLQAGPLLLKNGKCAPNTEKIRDNVMNYRHPRTMVGTDGERIMWAVIDGRDRMHSVGATIEETKALCKRLGMKTALNLDGGGSSSLWWLGMTFSMPSNAKDEERPIPYAVLMFAEGYGVRD